jgi:putative transposase
MNNKYAASFYEGGIFHVYNRTNNKEKLFASDENRRYFLRQYAKYLSPFVDTFCWNLLPNHFHFLVQVKSDFVIQQYFNNQEAEQLKPVEKKYVSQKATVDEVLELEWKRLFTSYSMAFNKQQGRAGNLFHRPFKRVEVNKDSHFTQAVVYIHANAIKHKLCKDFYQHKWSSWHSIINDKPTLLSRDKLIDWFGGLPRFIEVHESQTEFYYLSDIAIEDD